MQLVHVLLCFVVVVITEQLSLNHLKKSLFGLIVLESGKFHQGTAFGEDIIKL